MSWHSKKRLVFSYVLLVGIPLLGVMSVLGAGRRLTPPISVAGNWDFQIDSTATQAQSCFGGLGFTHSNVFSISQSGRYLTLKINNQPWATLTGTLQGKAVAANLSLPLAVRCDDAAGLSLTAQVDLQAVPRIMAGTLKFEGCPACETGHFRATRREVNNPKTSE